MRAYFCKKLLDRWEWNPPERFRVMQIQILADMTAKAFDVSPIRIRTSSADRALKKYGAFTKYCTRKGKTDPRRLYGVSYALGQRIRRASGFTNGEDLKRLLFFLYRNIGIHMEGSIPGEIIVSSCYFGQIYTPAQCALISYIDSGVAAGLYGGGKLVFSQRLTEGCGQCLACFYKGGNRNA